MVCEYPVFQELTKILLILHYLACWMDNSCSSVHLFDNPLRSGKFIMGTQLVL